MCQSWWTGYSGLTRDHRVLGTQHPSTCLKSQLPTLQDPLLSPGLPLSHFVALLISPPSLSLWELSPFPFILSPQDVQVPHPQ